MKTSPLIALQVRETGLEKAESAPDSPVVTL